MHVARVMIGLSWDQVSLRRVAAGCAEKIGAAIPSSRKEMKQAIVRYLNRHPAEEQSAIGLLASKKSARTRTRKPSKSKPFVGQPIGKPHPEYKKDDRFYLSREWRELRYKALVLHGAACQCCGAKAADGVRIHVDHVEPVYKRPDLKLSLENLQVLCDDCNIGKGAWDSTDWRGHFKSI